jgi:small membrane protein
MRQLGIQLLLVVGTLAVAWRLLAGSGQRTQAMRRLGLLALAGFAIWSIFFPDVWTSLAKRVGIGRGADLILYGLVVAFFGFVVTTYKRFRAMETRYTRLARRIALDESEPAVIHRSRSHTGAPAALEPATDSGDPSEPRTHRGVVSPGDRTASSDLRTPSASPIQPEATDAD